jgi:NAD(P)-dependent dehydrogenase (short-subunit alcohol dehydrogenase family)
MLRALARARKEFDMDDQPPTHSRRDLVRGIVGAVAVTAAVPARAEQMVAAASPGQGPKSAPRNPATAYPKPPFPRQSQDWPGLQSKMTPRPDCGEQSYRGSGRLAGRKALITGGDSGIGRAAAIAFAREGADVAINYLSAEEPDAREVIALIAAAGRKGVAVPGDIRDEGFCQQMVARAARDLGGLDIVVNNAGKQHAVERIEDLSAEQFDATFKTNVYAMFWITKAAMPHLGPGAAIINTASVEAYAPEPHLLDYASTKACIVAFTKSLAKQVAKRGIRVNAVAPGPYWTPLQVTGGQLPEKQVAFGQNTPLGRPGQPIELGPVYVLLASAEASDTTGQVYGASGGSGNP